MRGLVGEQIDEAFVRDRTSGYADLKRTVEIRTMALFSLSRGSFSMNSTRQDRAVTAITQP